MKLKINQKENFQIPANSQKTSPATSVLARMQSQRASLPWTQIRGSREELPRAQTGPQAGPSHWGPKTPVKPEELLSAQKEGRAVLRGLENRTFEEKLQERECELRKPCDQSEMRVANRPGREEVGLRGRGGL